MIQKQLGGRAKVALHGTNGFSKDLMRSCIAAGATKINVNRIVLNDYYGYIRARTGTEKSHVKLLEESVDRVINQTVEWMEVVGSAKQAP